MRSTGVLLVMALLMAACGSSAKEDAAESSAPAAPTPEPERTNDGADGATIEVSLSLYVLTDADDPGSVLSSRRSTEEVGAIAEKMQEIWRPAGIELGPIHVQAIEAPAEVLEAIVRSRDLNPFFDQAGRTFDVPDASILNGFYVAGAAGVNGFAPIGSTVFFVVDEPSVHDERVSSHEIGHLLGLRHAAEDADRLMFSGTNGMTLTGQEMEVARYGAQGLVDAAR